MNCVYDFLVDPGISSPPYSQHTDSRPTTAPATNSAADATATAAPTATGTYLVTHPHCQELCCI